MIKNILMLTILVHTISLYSLPTWHEGSGYNIVSFNELAQRNKINEQILQQEKLKAARKKLVKALIACKDDSYSYVALLDQNLIDTICQELEVIDKPNSQPESFL